MSPRDDILAMAERQEQSALAAIEAGKKYGYDPSREALEYVDIARILKAGKAPGILTPDRTLAAHYLKLGAVFVAVGLDTQLLMRHTTDLAAHFKAEVTAITPNKGATY